MRYVFLFVGFLMAQCAFAGEVLRLVNDEVISDYDVSQRLAMRRAFDPQVKDNKATRQKVLEDLVDEKLKIQAAKQLNLEVSDAEVEQAIVYLAGQNQIQPEKLKANLAKQGVAMETLQAQTRADLLWLRYMQHQQVKAEDISAKQIKKLRDSIKKDMSADRYLLSVIYIPYGKNKEQAEQKAQEAFNAVVQGESFSQIAQKYSSGVHAKAGGDLGWVKADTLDALLQKVVAVMNVGQLSKPVAGKSGYYIALLREKMPGMTSSEMTSVVLSQILVPKDQIDMVANAVKMAQNCEQFNELAKQYGAPGSGPVGDVVVERVPPEMAGILEQTPMRTASEPIQTPTEFVIFMKCDQRQISVMPDDKVLRQRLEMESLEKQSNDLLKELRQQAVIE
ncbi:MAG: peptidylprolyl isomerase [Alphaproteobacteria bacterium]|nr:peptidylprolyl isomerase [Alphaproteobacteria bacterium]